MIQKGFESKIQIQDIIENQIPEFVTSDNPKFTEFLRQYYVSLENQGSTYDIIDNLSDYVKLDNFRPEIVSGSIILNSDISSTDTDITVSNTKGFPEKYGLIKIGDEIITYKSKNSTQFLDCVRGFSGVDKYGKTLSFLDTNANSHTSGSSVENLSVLFLKEFYNKIKFTLLPELESTSLHKDVNLNLFLANSSSFYRSKGSNESIIMLFKALYNIEPIVVDLEKYLVKSSSANYLRRNEVIFQTVFNSSNLDPLKLIGQQIFKNDNLSSSAPVSEIEILTREGRSYFKFLFFIGNDENTSSPVDNFNVTPSSKLVTSIQASNNQTTITLDSTVSFKDSGSVFYVDSNGNKIVIFYREKTLNQLLGCYTSGYEYINVNIPKSSIVYDNDLYFGYENGDTEKKVELILVSNSTSVNVNYTDKKYSFAKDEIGYVTSFGNPLDTNELNNLSKIERISKSLYYNTSIRYQVSSFSGRTLILKSRIDDPSVLRVGDAVEFLERNTEINAREINQNISSTIEELTSAVILRILGLSDGTYQVEIDQSTSKLSSNKTYDIRRLVKTTLSNNIPFEYENLTTDIINTYTDDDNSLYIASNSLPSYLIDNNIFEYQIESISDYLENKFKWSSILLSTSTVNGRVVYPSLISGDIIYYDYTGSPIDGLRRGIYYIEIDANSKNKFKLYNSRTSIGSSNYVLINSDTIPTGTHTITLYAQKSDSKKLSSKKLFKKVFNDSTEINGNYEIGTKPVGILANGVEIISPNSSDGIYYGPIESVTVISSGKNYDILNPPQLRFESGNAKIEPVLHGNISEVVVDQQLFDIKEPVNLTVSGGNSKNVVLKPIVLLDSRSVTFNARGVDQGGGLDPSADTITFIDDHNFYNGQKVYYDINDINNAPIGIGFFDTEGPSYTSLSNNSSFFVDVVNSRTVRLYPSKFDYSAGINTVGLGTEGNTGIHKFRTEPQKKLKKVVVENQGSGFTYRKLPVSQSAISTTHNLVTFKNHGFESGELVSYTYETSPIEGLSNQNQYYILKYNNDSFRLCNAGIGGTIKTNYDQENYVKFNSTGSGYQYFKYPDIEINVTYQSIVDNSQNTIVATPKIYGGIIDTYVYEKGSDYGSTILNVEKKPKVNVLSGKDGLIKVITESGKIIRALVLYSGSDYYSVPDLEITDPTGSGAILRAEILNGKLFGVQIIDQGINYSKDLTEVTIKNRGNGAIFSANIRKLSVDNSFKYGKQYQSNREPSYDIIETSEGKLTYSIIGYRQELSNFFNITPSSHSPIIGVAYDGNPIYGPYGFSDPNNLQSSFKLMESGYSLDPNSVTNRPSLSLFQSGYFTEDYKFTNTGDLDEFNGRFCKTPEFPNGTYAYFATTKTTGSEIIAKYPYFIKNYRNRPVTENIDGSLNQSSSVIGLKRNTTPYMESNTDSKYDFFVTPKSTVTNTIQVDSVTRGSVDNIKIQNGGSNFKVGDNLNFKSTDSGYGLDVKVTKVLGKNITDLSTEYKFYQSKLYKIGDYEYEIKILPSHEILNNSKVSISGLNTSFQFLKNLHVANVKEFSTNLTESLSLGSNSVGVVTDIVVDNLPSQISIGGSIRVDNGSVENYYEVLNFYEKYSTIRCLKTIGSDQNIESGSKVTILPTRFTINTKTKSESTPSKENNLIYFNPSEVVAISTLSGATVPLSFKIGSSSVNVEIPSKSIYIPNHNLNNGQKVTFNRSSTNVGAFIVRDSEYNSFSIFESGQTQRNLWIIKKSDDVIGIATRSVDVYGTDGLAFYDETITVYSDTYKDYYIDPGYSETTCQIDQIISTVSVSTSHLLSNDDEVELNAKSNTTVGFGQTDFIKLRYLSSIDDISVKDYVFSPTDVDLTENKINIVNHQLNSGDAVYYISTSVIGGITTGIYYVNREDPHNIKLSETYKNSTSNTPITLDLTSLPFYGTEPQNLYLISPKIDVPRNSDLKFDVSDSSLDGYNLDFYEDQNFSKKYISSGSDLNFAVSVGVGTVTLKYSDNTPSELYYAISDSEKVIKSKVSYSHPNKINYVDSVYNNKFTIFNSLDTKFSFYLDQVPEALNYTQSNTDTLEYYTSSPTATGSIISTNIINGGYLYTNTPNYSGSNSLNGSSEIIIAESNSIGKLNSTLFKNTGFEYSSDTTLSPKIEFSKQIDIIDSQYVTNVEVVSGGYGFYYEPNLVIVESNSGKLVNNGSVSATLSDGSQGTKSIVSVEINTPITGLANTPVEIRSINNTNSIRIDKVTSSTSGILTCTLSTPTIGYPSNNQPFANGSEVFVENIQNVENTGIGFNSANHGYSFFKVISYSNTIPATIELEIPKLFGNPGVALTTQLNTYASVSSKENYPIFKVTQDYADFLEGETILVLDNNEVIETDLIIVKAQQNKLKYFGSYRLKVGQTLRGSYSGFECKIQSLSEVDCSLEVSHQKKVDVGWLDDTGMTSVDTQYLPDNDYYQNLSYTIKSEKSWLDVSSTVNSIVHPSGTKNFADMQLSSNATSRVSIGTVGDAKLESVTSLFSSGNTQEVRNFEMVVDGNVINDSFTNEIKFNSLKLTSFNLVESNRALEFDDISYLFASKDDLESFETLRLLKSNNKPYIKYLIQGKNLVAPNIIGDPIDEIQLTEIIVLSDVKSITNAEKYSLSNTGIATGTISKYFDVYADMDNSSDIKLYFNPADTFNSDYEIKVISTTFDESLVTEGTKEYDHVQTKSKVDIISNNSSTNLLSLSTLTKSSFISEIAIQNIDPNNDITEYVEIYCATDGTNQVYADYVLDTRKNDGSIQSLVNITPSIDTSNNVLRLTCSNNQNNTVKIISNTIVFDSSPTVGLGSTSQFKLNNQSDTTCRTALIESRYDEIVGLTTIRSYDVNLFTSFKSIIQVVSGNVVSLHHVLGVHDENNSYITEAPLISTKGTGGINNVVGIFTSNIEDNNFNLAFIPYSETDTIKISQYNKVFYKVYDTNVNPEPLINNPLRESFTKNLYFGKNSPYTNRTSFPANYKGTPIFAKKFDPQVSSILDPSTGIFTIPNHFFSDRERLVYESGSTFVGLGASDMHINPSTDISGITTDILPKDVFAIKISDSQFKLATNESDAENSIGVTFTYTGTGNAHKLTMAKLDSKSLVSVDNLVQYPLTSTNISHATATNVGVADTYISLTGISSIFPTDTIKINDEYIRIIDVGRAEQIDGPITYISGNYELVEVERGAVGSTASSHLQGDTVDVYKGSFRISGENIDFTAPPKGAPGGIDELNESNLPRIRSKFNARAFLRKNYESNSIFDDFSGNFDGITRSFELTRLGVSTIGFNTNSTNPLAVSSSDPETVGAGNGMLFINGLFQKPQTLNADTYNFFITQDAAAGVSTVTFTGNDLLNPTTNEYDVNTNQIPRGGLIVSLGSTAGLGYAPLYGASVYLRTDVNGGIGEVIGIGTTGTAFQGITTADYNNTTGLLQITTSTQNIGILTAFDTRFVKLVGLSFTCSGYENDGSSLDYPTHDNPLSIVGIFTDSFIVDVGVSTITHHYVGNGTVFPYYDRLTFGSGYNEYKYPDQGRQPISYELDYDSHSGSDAEFNITVVEGGELDIQVTSPGDGYVNPRLKIESPDYENLEVVGISRLGIGATTETGVGMLINVEIGSNTDQNAQPVGLGSTFFNVSNFKITRSGYKFKVGDVFTPVGLVTAKGYSEPIDQFKLVVLQTFNDNCSVFQLGEFDYLDSIKSYQNGSRTVFPLSYDSRRISFETDSTKQESALINMDSLLVIFINGVIQVPGESYVFDGGASITFSDPPLESDIIEMFFYVGTRGIDSSLNIVDETIKIGDELKIQNLPSNTNTLDQRRRTVHDLASSAVTRTNPYTREGISDSIYRPVTWIKQTQDIVIDQITYTKVRDSLESQVYPTARIIYDLNSTDNYVFVDNADLFDYENNSSKNNLIILPNQEAVGGAATAIVDSNGSISSIDVTNPGQGYNSQPLVKIANPIIGIGTNRSWYNVGIGTTADVGIGTTATASASLLPNSKLDTISVTNPGSGYTTSNPPQVIVEEPDIVFEEVLFVDTVQGFSGIIVGIGTTVGDTDLGIEFEIRSTSRPADDGYADLLPGYPIYIFNTSCGEGLTSIDHDDTEIVGISTQFVDNIYIIKQITTTDSNTGIITCNIASDTNHVGIASTGTYINPVGHFSWGKLSGFNRSNNPISIGVTGNVVSGLSTYPEIRRTGFKSSKLRDADAKGLRNSGSLDKTI